MCEIDTLSFESSDFSQTAFDGLTHIRRTIMDRPVHFLHSPSPFSFPHLHFNTNQFCFLLVPQNTKTKTLCFLLISKKLIKRQNPYEIAILFLAKKYIKFKVKKKKLTNALKKIIYKNFMEKKRENLAKKLVIT